METLQTVSQPTTSSIFDFESKFVEIQGHAIHYVEFGEGDPVLFIHGNPTSSYLYRNVIKPVANGANRRCIAIDMLGFGKSDKPQLKHNCALHVGIIEGFIRTLELENIILVGEDWGGFFGGYIMTRYPEWFQSAVMMETFWWPLTYEDDFEKAFVMPFKLMRSPVGGLFSKRVNLMINKLIPEHCPISKDSLQYYKDSVPTYQSKKAIGDFPKMLPANGKPQESYDMAMALQNGLKNITFPMLWIKADPGVVVSHNNPIGMKRLEYLQQNIPSLEVRDFGTGFHFLTEERPEKVASMVSDWINAL